MNLRDGPGSSLLQQALHVAADGEDRGRV